MDNVSNKYKKWIYIFFLVVPFFSLALFFVLKRNKSVMNFWVFKIAGPFEQFLGRICSVFPFSVLEIAACISVILSLIFIIVAVVSYFRNKDKRRLVKRAAGVLIFWLWVVSAFNWLWNAVYYASTFSERSNLQVRPYSVEELAAVTDYFACNAAELSDEIKRDEKGLWNENLDDVIKRAPENYKAAEELFPCLEMKSVEVKPFLFSRVQSMLGFTGMYTPYTGEANINIDAPPFLIPSTICHEMTHQRMVAPEDECNFVGIMACIACDDVVYQYSGYLSGLIHLSNALYSVSPDIWYSIANERFTIELYTDWVYNGEYWRRFESPVEEISGEVYDKFLKHNDQELGNKSYGACVDLIIDHFLDVINEEKELSDD